MAKNRNYLLLGLTYNAQYGSYSCLGAIVSSLVTPFGYSTSETSILGATFIVAGLIGSFVCSYFLDKHKTYLKVVRTISAGCVIFAALFYVTLPSKNIYLFTANIFCLGFCMIPIIPVGYAFSVELTFPVSEAMSNGIYALTAQILGSLLTVGATKLSNWHYK